MPKIIRYNKLCGSLRSLAHRISLLPPQDSFRARMEGQILSKLYDIGVLNSQVKLSDVDNKLTVAAFCRRRLAVIMVTSKMAETVSAVGIAFFGQCDVLFSLKIRRSNLSSRAMSVLDLIILPTRLILSRGECPNFIKCPIISLLRHDFLIRHMEDFVTWVDTSKLKRTVMRYNDEVGHVFDI